MSVYLQLYHGRLDPGQILDGWGFDGPVLGPFPHVHVTYGSTIDIGEGPDDRLDFGNDGLLKFEDCYYGDFTVLGDLSSDPDVKLLKRWERTREVLMSTVHDWPLMIHDKEPWVQSYVKHQLSKESPDEKAHDPE
jgi:hypothetical protein